MKEAASPPLSFSFAAQATGPLLRPQGWLRIALRATALRAALDPGDLGGPWRQEERAGQGLPRRARGAEPRPRTRELRRRVNWCSIRSTSEKLQDPLRGSLHTSRGLPQASPGGRFRCVKMPVPGCLCRWTGAGSRCVPDGGHPRSSACGWQICGSGSGGWSSPRARAATSG